MNEIEQAVAGTVESFEFEGRSFEIKAERVTALSGAEFVVWAAYRDGRKESGIKSHRNIYNVKRQIVENYETANSESYKTAMAAAEAAKENGEDAKAAIDNARRTFLNSSI